MDTSIVLAFGMLFVSWLLLRPSREPRSTVAESASQHATLSVDQRHAATAEIARMELRILEQHRELEAALQTRVAMLDTLIADADERIADLRQQIEFADDSRRRAA